MAGAAGLPQEAPGAAQPPPPAPLYVRQALRRLRVWCVGGRGGEAARRRARRGIGFDVRPFAPPRNHAVVTVQERCAVAAPVIGGGRPCCPGRGECWPRCSLRRALDSCTCVRVCVCACVCVFVAAIPRCSLRRALDSCHGVRVSVCVCGCVWVFVAATGRATPGAGCRRRDGSTAWCQCRVP